jgi:hypothetical protein
MIHIVAAVSAKDAVGRRQLAVSSRQELGAVIRDKLFSNLPRTTAFCKLLMLTPAYYLYHVLPTAPADCSCRLLLPTAPADYFMLPG